MKGTGRATSQPAMSTALRVKRSASTPEAKFTNALTTPKAMMKENTTTSEPMPNSPVPMSGTTVRSRPTIPPTKALTKTKSENCCQFSRRPSRTLC